MNEKFIENQININFASPLFPSVQFEGSLSAEAVDSLQTEIRL